MTTTTVAPSPGSASFLAALAKAQAGDTILLGSGQHPAIGIQGRKFLGAGVIITAGPPQAYAKVSGIEADEVAGLHFSKLDLDVNVRVQKVLQITHADDITVDGCIVADYSGLKRAGVQYRWVTHGTLTNTKIHDVTGGVMVIESKDITITGNDLRNMFGDGIQGSTDCSKIKIANNYFTDFFPSPGDHPDAIQFFTYGSKGSITDVEILDNTFERGAGETVQGIFLGNETNVPYQRIRIVGNAIIGGMWNGIAAGIFEVGEISGNLVLPMKEASGTAAMGSSIVIDGGKDVVVKGNVGTILKLHPTANLSESGNAPATPITFGSKAELTAWLKAKTGTPASATPTVDPKDALIAEWKAKYETATANDNADQLKIAQLTATIGAMDGAAKTASKNFLALFGDKEDDRARMTKARAAMAAALAEIDTALGSNPIATAA